jgi:hypothetical protein
MNRVNKIIDEELTMFNKGIVATPQDRAALDSFAKANQGSSDIILTQMAVQFGYNEALKRIKRLINDEDNI